MNFRTEIETPAEQPLEITHDDRIVMLGSCFTDNVGERLERDGFDVVHNPMGQLYNPASIHQAVSMALLPEARENMLIRHDAEGNAHCLNFASRYVDKSEARLRERVNAELDRLRDKLLSAKVVILTLGTALVYHIKNEIVGNCHKFAPQTFTRTLLSISEVRDYLTSTISLLPTQSDIIFTVSPIRHTADTLHGNQISKSTLQMALVDLVPMAGAPASKHLDTIGEYTGQRLHYFPSYEIMLDDLRDYRFYASDMKHPSDVAVDYIYEVFSEYYFKTPTLTKARACRKEYMRQAHRPIITQS